MYIYYVLENIVRQRNLNLQMGDFAKLNIYANSMYIIFHAFNLLTD